MITFCIPSKNNLCYLKLAVDSIKSNSKYDNEIIIFIDSDNDGTEQYLIEQGIQYIKNNSAECKGIAFGYNRCIELAKHEIICCFHADMYMAIGFDENVVKYIKPQTIVSATRIEPPLHPCGKEKIVADFGMYPEDFERQRFDDYVVNLIDNNQEVTTNGIFAPFYCYKSDIMNIGMHDETFHSYYEDSDIFNRFILNKFDIIQTWNSFVYHFTCRGGQFQDGVEKITTDTAFHKMKDAAAWNYIRKWGSWVENDENQHPIIYPKYYLIFVVKGMTALKELNYFEPYCSRIYTDLAPELIDCCTIPFKAFPYTYNTYRLVNDGIIVKFNCKELTRDDYAVFRYGLNKYISENITECGEYQVGNILLNVNDLRDYNYTNIINTNY